MKHLPLLLALLLSLPVAAAQSLRLSPVVVTLDPAHTLNASVTFTNTSSQPVSVDVNAAMWMMKDGQHIEAPTRDLLVTPTTFSVAPGESQVIRIGLRRKPAADELTYRLHLIQQSPAPPAIPSAPTGTPSVDVYVNKLFAVTVPVYVTPTSSMSRLGFSVQRQGDDLILVIQNAGNRHATLYDLVLSRADQHLQFPPNAVLAGGTLTYTLPGWSQLSGTLSLQYTTPEEQVIRVSPAVP